MILKPPESVQKLQTALQAKAKGSPGYRFYLLYDKLYRKDGGDGTCLSGHATVEEEPQPDHRGYSRVHRTEHDVAGGRSLGFADQWQAGWLGKLLFVGPGQQGLSRDRGVHQASAASVARREAQGAEYRPATFPGRVPV